MFTGIIEATGTVFSVKSAGETRSEANRSKEKSSEEKPNATADTRITIQSSQLDFSDVKIGDSIAVNGCCLTVVELGAQTFSADVSNETLACTTLGNFSIGTRVNLEKAMQATARFGGHIVSGHVDGVGELLESVVDGASMRLSFAVPATLAHYIAAKGSICIDGTSLTVNTLAETMEGTLKGTLKGTTFTVNIIPHTQQETVIGDYKTGQQVNLEVDIVARYLERLLQARQ